MDKKKYSDGLDIATEDLVFQQRAELISATRQLAFQNEEKEKLAAELIIANIELVFQNEEKEKRAAELIMINKELVSQIEEKEKLAEELTVAYKELKKAEVCLMEHARGLEEMMFMTSHRVRQPIAHILGIAYLFNKFISLPKTLKVLLEYIKQSALALDAYTKELTVFMSALEQKGKCK